MKKIILFFLLVFVVMAIILFFYMPWNELQVFMEDHKLSIGLIVLGLNAIGSIMHWVCTHFWFEEKRNELGKDAEMYRHQLNKDADKHKHQLNMDFIKAEIRSKKLPDLYCELLTRYKRVEAVICKICSDKQKNIDINSDRLTDLDLLRNNAVNFMVENILFISSDIEKQCDYITYIFMQLENYLTSKKSSYERQEYKQEIRNGIDVLLKIMRQEIQAKGF